MTPQRHLYLAAYDIRSDRLRVAALNLLRGYATGGQKSVHEVWLTAAEKRGVLTDMAWLLGSDDRFALLRLDPRARTLVRGRALPPAEPALFYVG